MSGVVLYEGVVSEDGPQVRVDRGDGAHRVYGRDGVLREEQVNVDLGVWGGGGDGAGGQLDSDGRLGAGSGGRVLSGGVRLTYPTAGSGHTYRTRARTTTTTTTAGTEPAGGLAKLTVGGRSQQLRWQPDNGGLRLEDQQDGVRLVFDSRGRLSSARIGVSVDNRDMAIITRRQSDGGYRHTLQVPGGQVPGGGAGSVGYELAPFGAGWKVTTRGGVFDGQDTVFDYFGYAHPHGPRVDSSVRAQRVGLPELTARYAQHIQPPEQEDQELLELLFPSVQDGDGQVMPMVHPLMDQAGEPDVWHNMINTAEVVDDEDDTLGTRSDPARQLNCALTALALNEAWFGAPQIAPTWKSWTDRETDDLIPVVMQEYAGVYPALEPGSGPGALDAVERKLRKLGHGSAAIISFDWTLGNRDGHAMNILNDRGTLVYSDAQVSAPVRDKPHQIANVTSFVFDPNGNPVAYHPLIPGAAPHTTHTSTQDQATTQDHATTPVPPDVEMNDTTPAPVTVTDPVVVSAPVMAGGGGALPGFTDTPADGLCLITSVLWSMTPQARTAVYLHLQTHSRIHPISRLARFLDDPNTTRPQGRELKALQDDIIKVVADRLAAYQNNPAGLPPEIARAYRGQQQATVYNRLHAMDNETLVTGLTTLWAQGDGQHLPLNILADHYTSLRQR
ncbi:hypothetical protein FKR81_41140, partial [Lentzea tibetensis]